MKWSINSAFKSLQLPGGKRRREKHLIFAGSTSTRDSKKTTRRRRKYDEEFNQQALAMVRNGQSPRSVAKAMGVSENLIHRWKRASRALPKAAEAEIEQLRRRLK